MKLTDKIKISKYSDGNMSVVEEDIVAEYPFTIILNGEEFITLLCSPSALEYLALGFLLSEGIIKKKSDIVSLKFLEDRGIVEIETGNKSSLAKELFGKRTMTTGCGKGTVFYNVIDSFQSKSIVSNLQIPAEDILKIMMGFNKASELFMKTGGVHSACLSNGKDILIFHEDVGRHNAVDKLIGEAMMKDIILKDKILITSGRISSEMLIKSVKQEIPILISRSAPTDLAVKLATQLDVTIIGFARGMRMNIYAKADRILF